MDVRQTTEKGGVADKQLIRRSRAYHRPTKQELEDLVEQQVREEEGDYEEEPKWELEAQKYAELGVTRQDFYNLFLLMDRDDFLLEYHSNIAELSIEGRIAYRAKLEEEWNEAHCKSFAGEAWA